MFLHLQCFELHTDRYAEPLFFILNIFVLRLKQFHLLNDLSCISDKFHALIGQKSAVSIAMKNGDFGSKEILYHGTGFYQTKVALFISPLSTMTSCPVMLLLIAVRK